MVRLREMHLKVLDKHELMMAMEIEFGWWLVRMSVEFVCSSGCENPNMVPEKHALVSEMEFLFER